MNKQKSVQEHLDNKLERAASFKAQNEINRTFNNIVRGNFSQRVNAYNLQRVNTCELIKTQEIAQHYNSAILRNTSKSMVENFVSVIDAKVRQA